MLSYELILNPSDVTKKIMIRRTPPGEKDSLKKSNWGAVLLIQGQVAELIGALDDAVKRAPLSAVEILGNCPQHIQTIALVGRVADCKAALDGLKKGGRVR